MTQRYFSSDTIFRSDSRFLLFNVPSREADWRRRCPSAWWAPPPSKRVGWVIPVRRVRFPSTSAKSVQPP